MIKEEIINYEWWVLRCPSCNTLFAVPYEDFGVIGNDYPKADKIKCYKCGYGADKYKEFIVSRMTANTGIKTITIKELSD